jgi:hypothetical protein
MQTDGLTTEDAENAEEMMPINSSSEHAMRSEKDLVLLRLHRNSQEISDSCDPEAKLGCRSEIRSENREISPLERSAAERKGPRAPEAKLGRRNSGRKSPAVGLKMSRIFVKLIIS